VAYLAGPIPIFGTVAFLMAAAAVVNMAPYLLSSYYSFAGANTASPSINTSRSAKPVGTVFPQRVRQRRLTHCFGEC
jgi:hypothetical protein